MKVLVVGATGMLGEPVARQLQADGYQVAVLSRNGAQAQQKFDSRFTVIEGDVENSNSLHKAMVGIDGVHISLAGGPKPEDYERIEHQGTANVVQAAAAAGVGRVTYLSGYSVNETNRAKNYQTAAKFGAETAVKASGIPYTIFRATWFMESLPLFIENGRALVVGKQNAPLRWLAVEDYARMVSKAFRAPDSANKVLYVYGPEPFTQMEAVKKYQEIVRPDTKFSQMPTWMLSLMGTLMRNAEMKDISQFMKYMEQVQEVGSPDEANAILGTPSTTLSEWCHAQIAERQMVIA